MTRSSSMPLLSSEFDGFLFAPVAEDRHGKLLSVLSALAQSDLDPWQEAAELARLPKEVATQRLISLIAALSDEPLAHLEPGTVAARLIALLPRQTIAAIAPRGMTADAGAAAKAGAARLQVIKSRAIKSHAALYIIIAIMTFLLGGQYIIASHKFSLHAGNNHAPASNTTFPEAR
jgi:hypothetical protein